MPQAIVLFPEFNGQSIIENIRKQYDPSYNMIKPHITLIYPFEKDFSEEVLEKHIRESIKSFKPFQMKLKGIRRSPIEYYLYLLIEEGNETVLKIHKKLYSKFLTKWLRTDIPYIPHITLGVFKSKKEIDKAMKILDKQEINFQCNVKSTYLLNLDDDLTQLKSFTEFRL